MARDFLDRDLRERVRRNVGRVPGFVVIPSGPPAPGRYGQLFQGGDLVGGTGTGPNGEPLPPLPTMPTLPQGRIIGMSGTVVSGTREVIVSDPIPAPCVIRALTLTGNISIAEAQSFRVLLSNDADSTAVADPTGTDLIEFSGDVIGAEDVGVHAHLSAGQLVVEPWKRVLQGGFRLKLKIHNVAGANRTIAVFADIDELVL